jgi:hypothetical protein
MADEKQTQNGELQVLDDGDTSVLNPQLSLSDELLLDQDEGVDNFGDSKKEVEDIPNLEEDDPV